MTTYLGGDQLMYRDTTNRENLEKEIFQLLSLMYKRATDTHKKYDLPITPLGLKGVSNYVIYSTKMYSEIIDTAHNLELVESSRDLNQLYTCKSLQIINRLYVKDKDGNPKVTVTRVPISLQTFLYTYVDVYKNNMTGQMLDYIITLMKKSKLSNGKDTIVKTYFDYIASVIGYSKGTISPTALLEALKILCLDENYVYTNIVYDNSYKSHSIESVQYMDGCMEHIINNLIYIGADRYEFYASSKQL